MTEDEFRQIIARHEADRVELTASTSKTDKFSEAVCAFSNDLPNHGEPGYLVIGVDDRGRFSGLTVTDELLRNLAGLREDGNIQPLPSIVVEKVVTSAGEVAVVTVQPSPMPPVRYKGWTCIRIGPRRGIATEAEERQLIERRVAYARTFDARPCLGSSLNDLSVSLFRLDYLPHAVASEIIEENHRTSQRQFHRQPARRGRLTNPAKPPETRDKAVAPTPRIGTLSEHVS